MARVGSLFLCVVLVATCASAIDNGLGLLPPMVRTEIISATPLSSFLLSSVRTLNALTVLYLPMRCNFLAHRSVLSCLRNHGALLTLT